MWTYQNQKMESSHPVVQTQAQKTVLPAINRDYMDRTGGTTRKTIGKSLYYMGGIYLCGVLAGAVSPVIFDSKSGLGTYIQYFIRVTVTQYQRQAAALFAVCMISYLIQCTALFLAGFSAWGGIVIPMMIFLKGIGSGIVQAALLMQFTRIQSLSAEILIFMPVDLIENILLLILSKSATELSQKIYRYCRYDMCSSMHTSGKRAVNLYLTECLIGVFPCGLCVILTAVFGKFCGLL